jgi:hypothetical protein
VCDRIYAPRPRHLLCASVVSQDSTGPLAVFHRPDFGVPARRAGIRALFVAGLNWLNEPEPQWLSAFGARPKRERLRRQVPKRFWHFSNLKEIRTSKRRCLHATQRDSKCRSSVPRTRHPFRKRSTYRFLMSRTRNCHCAVLMVRPFGYSVLSSAGSPKSKRRFRRGL